jgi:hypothetical protein
MNKKKDLFTRNQDNVFEWSDISTSELLFQWVSTIKILFGVLIKYKTDIILYNKVKTGNIAAQFLSWRWTIGRPSEVKETQFIL